MANLSLVQTIESDQTLLCNGFSELTRKSPIWKVCINYVWNVGA